MTSLNFSLVDVFSTTPYKGNPLAIVDTIAHTLSTAQQQLITRQFNLSETTFILPPTCAGATHKLRSFLPDGREVFGAGHNILGAWWQLAQSGRLDLTSAQAKLIDGTDEFVFQQELGDDVTPVEIRRKGGELEVILQQADPMAHNVHPDPAALASSLGLSTSDIGFPADDGTLLPPQVMSTSTTYHLLVPLASTKALNNVTIQRDKLLEQLALVDKRAYGLFLFARTGPNTYEARFFSPGMSGEDPATGSAAGPLSAYLYEHGALGLVDGAGEIKVVQGLRVGRECVMRVKLSVVKEGGREVRRVELIGGGAVVGEGKIAIPDGHLRF